MGSLKSQKPAAQPAAAPAAKDVTSSMNNLKKIITPEMIKSTNAVYGFSITDASPSEWYIDLKTEGGSLGSGAYSGKVDCTLTMNTDVFNQVVSGALKPSAAFMSGKLKIKGNMGMAMKLEKLMGGLKSKL